MSKVLVTGSNGFTGHYVCEYLKKAGYEVVGLVHSGARDFEVECDLLDGAALKKVVGGVAPNGVIHLAAQSFVGHSDNRAFYDVNLLGTNNLLDAVEGCSKPLDKVIIASSANIYGPVADAHIAETQLPNPINHYARSKLAMEYLVEARWDSLPILITRPFNYTGPGQHERFVIPKIVGHFRRGEKRIELGNLDVARDFSDVRDIAHAYLSLYTSDATSEIVNLCSATTYGLGNIIEMMNEIAGYPIEVAVNPDFVRENEIKELGGDNRKFKKLTGESARYTFPETLEMMMQAGQDG